MLKRNIIALICCIMAIQPAVAQQLDYSAFFEEAYRENPSIPRGLLESIAWNNTRMQHLVPGPPQTHDCLGMPLYYGVMGLVEDGKGYFNNTLTEVARLSGFSIDDIKRSPRVNILAYAKAYASQQVNKRSLGGPNFGDERFAVSALSEIPDDGSAHNQFCKDQQYYAVLRKMEQQNQKMGLRSVGVNYRQVFKENYDVLSASRLEMDREQVRNRSTGQSFKSFRTAEAPSCTKAQRFGSAIWSAANTRNYSSRKSGSNIEFVTIHTVQGSYASCISWFKNPAARVSAHYVIRSLDGQVTQMVCEGEKAWHVRTHNDGAIGIEHEGFIDEGYSWYSTAMYESSAALVRDICKRHNINTLQAFQGPATRGVRVLGDRCTKIKGHQHFKGNDHIDPGPYWDWDRFFRLINPNIKVQEFTDKKDEVYDSGGPNGTYALQEYRGIRIQPKKAEQVTLKFESFDLEEPDGKTFWDYLDIWDGPNRNGKYIGRFAGRRSPGTLVSNSGAFYMEFRSDCATNKAGWKASYTSKKRSDKPAPPSAFIARATYPLGATLAWDKVKKPAFYLVYLRRRNIGSQRWMLYKTSTETLHLTGLASDAIYQAQLAVVVDEDTSALTGLEFATPPVSKFGEQSLVIAVPFNSGRFNDSGGDEFGYGNNEAWVYSIRPENGKTVALKFNSFSLAKGDSLKVFDGPATSSKLIGRYGGDRSPGTITSKSAALTLQFTSNRREAGDGWVASWGTDGEASGPAIPVPDPVVTKPDPVTPSPVDINKLGPMEPNLHFPASPPRVEPNLKKSYAGSFSFDYNMRGRGTKVPFFSLLTRTDKGFRGRATKGFFYDDFTNKTLHTDWQKGNGTWELVSNRLVQRNDREANSALSAAVLQTQWSTYLYHTVIRLSGNDANKRAGFHFFADSKDKENRGNGYFFWARDGSSADYLEFYKVENDKLSLKKKQAVTLAPGKSYDIKVVYNPRKGRMEAYLDNRFALAWEDENPIQRGEFISLRTGGAVVEFDLFEVMKRRSGTETKVTVGSPSADVPVESPDKNTPMLRVRTIIADVRDRLYWSAASHKDAIVTFAGSTASNDSNNDNSGSNTGTAPDPSPNNTGSNGGTASTRNNGGTASTGNGGGSSSSSSGTTASTGGSGISSGNPPAGNSSSTSTHGPGAGQSGDEATRGNPAPKPDLGGLPSKGVWLRSSYGTDFIIEMAPQAGVADQFFLVSNKKDGLWQANGKQGFLCDDFGKMNGSWKAPVGNWSVDRYGHLVQSDVTTGNANFYHNVEQKSTITYLYHFKAYIQNSEENARFGLHFFANDPDASNRGDSYMVWIRNNNAKADKIEIYRSNDNALEKKRSATIDIAPGSWIDIKITYDPIVGKTTVYLDNKLAIQWRDDRIPLKIGSYISLRTGGASVLFDDFHVYQRYKDRYYIGVGRDPADHLQQPTEGRITTLERNSNDSWKRETHSKAKLRF